MMAYANERINALEEELEHELRKGMAQAYVAGFVRPTFYFQEPISQRTVQAYLHKWMQKYPRVNPYMRAWGTEMRQFFFDKIDYGMQQGMHPFEVAREIRKAEQGVKAYKARMIARTEMMRAYNAATLHRYKHSGVTTKEWSVLDPCPDCAAMSGEEVGINERFSCGLSAPPLHPNCKCVLIPGKAVRDNVFSIMGGVS
jgi:SPP1 gp7 family putative phage head morphogenesis protein